MGKAKECELRDVGRIVTDTFIAFVYKTSSFYVKQTQVSQDDDFIDELTNSDELKPFPYGGP